MHKLDHIVIGAYTLEEGTEFVETKLQAKLSDIGYHNDMGTHNRVIRISDQIYLEVVALDPQNMNLKNRKWFNLDNSNLQLKLKKSPQIIGYVIENDRLGISKYYDQFFEASRGEYRWHFAMPTLKKNILDIGIIETGIIPRYQMKKNQFELISFEINFLGTQNYINTFLKMYGEIEFVSVSTTTKENSKMFKLKIKDKLRDTIISI